MARWQGTMGGPTAPNATLLAPNHATAPSNSQWCRQGTFSRQETIALGCLSARVTNAIRIGSRRLSEGFWFCRRRRREPLLVTMALTLEHSGLEADLRWAIEHRLLHPDEHARLNEEREFNPAAESTRTNAPNRRRDDRRQTGPDHAPRRFYS